MLPRPCCAAQDCHARRAVADGEAWIEDAGAAMWSTSGRGRARLKHLLWHQTQGYLPAAEAMAAGGEGQGDGGVGGAAGGDGGVLEGGGGRGGKRDSSRTT